MLCKDSQDFAMNKISLYYNIDDTSSLHTQTHRGFKSYLICFISVLYDGKDGGNKRKEARKSLTILDSAMWRVGVTGSMVPFFLATGVPLI